MRSSAAGVTNASRIQIQSNMLNTSSKLTRLTYLFAWTRLYAVSQQVTQDNEDRYTGSVVMSMHKHNRQTTLSEIGAVMLLFVIWGDIRSYYHVYCLSRIALFFIITFWFRHVLSNILLYQLFCYY